jgi:hypothetical protein
MASAQSEEEWKCTLCSGSGKGFFGCWRHIKGETHQKELEDLAAEKEAEAKKAAEDKEADKGSEAEKKVPARSSQRSGNKK